MDEAIARAPLHHFHDPTFASGIASGTLGTLPNVTVHVDQAGPSAPEGVNNVVISPPPEPASARDADGCVGDVGGDGGRGVTI